MKHDPGEVLWGDPVVVDLDRSVCRRVDVVGHPLVARHAGDRDFDRGAAVKGHAARDPRMPGLQQAMQLRREAQRRADGCSAKLAFADYAFDTTDAPRMNCVMRLSPRPTGLRRRRSAGPGLRGGDRLADRAVGGRDSQRDDAVATAPGQRLARVPAGERWVDVDPLVGGVIDARGGLPGRCLTGNLLSRHRAGDRRNPSNGSAQRS